MDSRKLGCDILAVMFVCPGISGNSVPTAGPIETGEPPIDASIRRNDDGVGLGSISGTWHVSRAAA